MVFLAKCLVCLKSQNSESPPLCVRFLPLQHARGYKMLIESLGVSDFGEKPVYVPFHCSWYCNQHASGSRQSATEVWEWGSVLGRRRRPEIGVAWFTGHDTPGRIYSSWEPEVWECCLILLLTAHCRMIHFWIFKLMKRVWFTYMCVCVLSCTQTPTLTSSTYCAVFACALRH